MVPGKEMLNMEWSLYPSQLKMAGDEASEMGRYKSQTCLKYEAKESELYQRSYGVPLNKFNFIREVRGVTSSDVWDQVTKLWSTWFQ